MAAAVACGVRRVAARVTRTRVPCITLRAMMSTVTASHQRIRPRWGAFAAAAAGCAAAASCVSLSLCAAAPDVHVDTSTGLTFLKQLPPVADACRSQPRVLVGSGCRYKYGLVQVYAVALYVPAETATLSGQDFADKVISGSSPSTLIIKMKREVSAATMVDALQEAIKPRITANKGTDADIQAADKLGDLLLQATDKLVQGTEIDLSMQNEHGTMAVAVTVDNQTRGCIRNAQLCRALADTYVGPNAVSPQARDAFLTRK